MNCMFCPKKKQCSGADCYYDYHPEPNQELAEDIALMNELECNDDRYTKS